jgi:argininosuccinate lyase
LTELADTLVRDHGLPFSTAHGIAGLLLKARSEDPGASLAEALAKASEALVGHSLHYSDDDLNRIMSPRHFVDVRRTLGGPAPSETARAAAEQRQLLDRDQLAWQTRRDHVTRAEQELDSQVRQL